MSLNICVRSQEHCWMQDDPSHLRFFTHLLQVDLEKMQTELEEQRKEQELQLEEQERKRKFDEQERKRKQEEQKRIEEEKRRKLAGEVEKAKKAKQDELARQAEAKRLKDLEEQSRKQREAELLELTEAQLKSGGKSLIAKPLVLEKMTECRHGAQCTELKPTHPKHSVHMSRCFHVCTGNPCTNRDLQHYAMMVHKCMSDPCPQLHDLWEDHPFYHKAEIPQPKDTSAVASSSSPTTAPPTGSQTSHTSHFLPQCPVEQKQPSQPCPLAERDSDHLKQCRHRCRASFSGKCNDFSALHLRDFLHECAAWLQHGICPDNSEHHRTMFAHFVLPTTGQDQKSDQPTSTPTPATAELPTFPKGECKYGESCRFKQRKDPAHMRNYWHPLDQDYVDYKKQLEAAELKMAETKLNGSMDRKRCPNFTTYGKCNNKQPEHLNQYLHPCPHSACDNTSQQHLLSFLHPCLHGVSCPHFDWPGKQAHIALVDGEQKKKKNAAPPNVPPITLTPQQHLLVALHEPTWADPCSHELDKCPILTNSLPDPKAAHVIASRHFCGEYSRCMFTVPIHLLRYLHECPEGSKCALYNFDPKVRAVVFHHQMFRHPCPNPSCNDTTARHRFHYSHAAAIPVSYDVKYPQDWEAQTMDPQFFPVQQGSAEWGRVEKYFSIPNCTIQTIERYQNRSLYNQFYQRAKAVEARNGTANIKTLWHGTKNPVLAHILGVGVDYQGFDENMCSLSGSVGAGVYFAVQASYSHGGYNDNPDKLGRKKLLLCSVIAGKNFPAASDRSKVAQIREAPAGYDSVSNDESVMFVVYEGRRAYPDYLVTYK